jgi:hypothetical protein
LLERLALSRARAADLETIERRIGTVDYGARCYLGSQQAIVLASIHERFRHEFEGHLTGGLPPAEPVLIAELLDIRGGKAVLDERHRRKQPDWTFGRTSSGAAPADRKGRYRSAPLQLPSLRK